MTLFVVPEKNSQTTSWCKGHPRRAGHDYKRHVWKRFWHDSHHIVINDAMIHDEDQETSFASNMYRNNAACSWRTCAYASWISMNLPHPHWCGLQGQKRELRVNFFGRSYLHSYVSLKKPMFRKLLPKTTQVGLHANQSSQLSATVKHFLDQLCNGTCEHRGHRAQETVEEAARGKGLDRWPVMQHQGQWH